PHGSGCRFWGTPANVRASRTAAGGTRRGDPIGRGCGADASDVFPALWSSGSRPADLCRRRDDLDRGRCAGQLLTGTAGYRRRTRRCPAGRIVARRRTSHLNVAAWLKEIVPPAEVL